MGEAKVPQGTAGSCETEPQEEDTSSSGPTNNYLLASPSVTNAESDAKEAALPTQKPPSFTERFHAVRSLKSLPVAYLVHFPASLLRFVSGQMARQHRSISQVPNENRRPFGHLKSVCAFFFFSCRKRRYSSCHIHVTLLKMDEHLLVIAAIISCRIARKIERNGAFESTSRQHLVNNVLLWWRWKHIRGTLIEKMIVIMTIMTIIMSVTTPSKAGCCCSLTTFVLSLHSGRIQFEASSYHKQMAWGRPVGNCIEKLCTKEISKK